MIQCQNALLNCVVRTRVDAHIDQRKTSSLAVRLNGNEVLVSLGSYFQLHRVAAHFLTTHPLATNSYQASSEYGPCLKIKIFKAKLNQASNAIPDVITAKNKL